MAGLEELSLALRTGAENQARLEGLNEQYERAAAMRDAPMTGPDQYGQLSPLQTIADVLRGTNARRQLRELRPQRMETRQAVAANEHALPLYKAQVAEDTAAQTQSNFELTRADRLAKEQADRAEREGARSLNTYIHPETGDVVTVAIGADGRAEAVDGAGNPTSRDLTEYVPYRDFTAMQKAANDKRYGGLKPSQLQAGLKDYRKSINPIMPIIQGVNNLNEQIMALPDPNREIPGIGYVEGGTGLPAQAIRALGPQEGQDIHSAWTQTIAPLIREQAGLAQTRTELERVEQQFGGNWLSNEDTFRKAYPQVIEALKRDLETIDGTFLPGVSNYYKDTLQAKGHPSIFDYADEMVDPFKARREIDKSGGNASTTTSGWTDEKEAEYQALKAKVEGSNAN